MKIKVNTLKNVIIVYIVLVLSVITYYLIRKSFIVFDEHSFVDYLINYQDGGFKRRGLIGTIAIIVNNSTGVSLSNFVFIVSFLPYLIIVSILIKYIKTKEINKYSIIILVSPICFGFYLNNYQAIGRKESLFIAIFSVFVYCYEKFNNIKVLNIITSIVLSLLVLTHELTYLFLGYFIMYDYVKTEKINYKRILLLSILPTIAFIIVLISGTDIDRGETKSMLLERGIVLTRIGILDWDEKGFRYFEYINEYLWGYMLYIIPFLFTCYYSQKSIIVKVLKKRIILLYIFAFAFSFPLFLTAIDWGRWVHIHSIMQLMLILSLLQKENRETINLNMNKIILIIIMVICMLFLKVKHLQRALSYKTIFVELFMKSINKNYPHNHDTLGY